MTKIEFGKFIHRNFYFVNDYFNRAGEVFDDIREKNELKGERGVTSVDWTLDELCRVMDCNSDDISPLYKELLKENWKKYDHGGHLKQLHEKDIYENGMRAFLNLKYKPKCCETCVYLTGSRIMRRGSRVFPYCNLYQRFLTLENLDLCVNIFKDKCKSYERAEPPYRIWYSKDAPNPPPVNYPSSPSEE